jgi:hypothetical protein
MLKNEQTRNSSSASILFLLDSIPLLFHSLICSSVPPFATPPSPPPRSNASVLCEDVADILAMGPLTSDVNPGQANTDGRASSSFTSSSAPSNTSNATRKANAEECREAKWKLMKKVRGERGGREGRGGVERFIASALSILFFHSAFILLLFSIHSAALFDSLCCSFRFTLLLYSLLNN